MQISIVVPACNEEAFIGDCLKAIDQHLPENVEVVVVDNGSVDDTARIVRQYDAELISLGDRVFPSTARNRGYNSRSGGGTAPRTRPKAPRRNFVGSNRAVADSRGSPDASG